MWLKRAIATAAGEAVQGEDRSRRRGAQVAGLAALATSPIVRALRLLGVNEATLEVAMESATAHRRHIEDERARAALERIAGDISRSSKLGKLARSLLAN